MKPYRSLVFSVFALLLVACGGDDPKKGMGDAEKESEGEAKPLEGGAMVPDARRDSLRADSATSAQELKRAEDELKAEDDFLVDDALLAYDDSPDPDPTEFVKVQQEPQFLNEAAVRKKLVMPESLRREGVRGTVYVKILVGLDGKYRSHYVRKSPDKRLTQIVVSAIQFAEFKPAQQGGKPVKTWYDFRHTF